jgi:OOP family OmpA-OmpF porin
MKKSIPTILGLMFLVFLWTVASVQAIEIVTREMIEKETITETDLIKTADNVIILFDTSSSTNEMVPGKNISKIQAAKNLLAERNAWLPDLGYQAGLYIYTDHETLVGTFKEVYGMQPYDRDRFAAAIDQLPEQGQGGTTLNAGLSPLRKVVAGLSGKTAVIMFTDGKITRLRGTKMPLQIAQEIARDNDVCFYLISSATEEMNAQMLESVTQVNACSRVIPIAAFMDNPQYLSGALFVVRTTSYTRLKPMTQTVGVFVDDVLFDFDSSVLRSEYNAKLDELGDYLVKNPDAFLVVGGFADSVGDDEYNMWLSKRRALSIKSYLLGTYDIAGERVVLQWFGENNPAADNATEEGRQLNRRVEMAVGTAGGM